MNIRLLLLVVSRTRVYEWSNVPNLYFAFSFLAGIGEYLNVDPTVIRLLWVLFCFAGGSGILAYIIAAIVMPEPRY